MNNLYIYGCGGLGLEVLSYIKTLDDENQLLKSDHNTNQLQYSGFIDEGTSKPRTNDAGRLWNRGHEIHDHPSKVPAGSGVVIALGNPIERAKTLMLSLNAGLIPITIVHPTAVISPTAIVDQGCILAPFSFVGPFAKLGQNSLVNTYASVGHDAVLGDSCVLSPNSTLNGFASCGPRSFLGTASTILVGKKLGAYSKLSAGSVLTTDTDDGALAVGNPAKWRIMFRDIN